MQIATASAGSDADSAGCRVVMTRWVKMTALAAWPVSGSKSSSAYTAAAYGSWLNLPCGGRCRARTSLPSSSVLPVRFQLVRLTGPCVAA